MSSARAVVNIRETLLEAATDMAWRQWSAIGAPAAARQGASAIVDPEALVLLSLALVVHERRLWDMLAWQAGSGVSLLSVQRTKNLARAYSPAVQERVREFAYLALERGHDSRWRSLKPREPTQRAREKVAVWGPPALLEPPALLLRLRMGIGVGIKSDVLGLLLGIGGAHATVREIVAATGYTQRAVRRAADEMAAADLIVGNGEGTAAYHAEPDRWAALLELRDTPRWRHWHALFALMEDALAWTDREETREAGAYVLASRARDLYERHHPAFSRNRITVPDPARHMGAAYLPAFEESISILAAWTRENT